VQVDQLRLEPWGEGRELSGRVTFHGAGLEPERLWFRSPVAPAGQPDGSPFLAALLMLSMRLAEPLHIEGPVSPLLVESVPRVSLVLRSWWPWLVEPEVSVAQAAAPADAHATGVFFTRGVDSWHSALETLDEGAVDVRLLGWPGADLPVYETGEYEAESAVELRDAAAVAGARLDLVESNARRIVNPHVHWSDCHGGLLAAVALAHGGLAEARVAGTLPLGNLVALGSHPLLDPLWSTEATRVVHHTPETTRVDKIAALGPRPGVLARLRVCDHTRPTGNCGRCGKCVRTMIGLELCGLSGSAPFDETLTPGRIRRLSVRTSVERAFGEELLEAAGRQGRSDLSEPLQLAFAADQAQRARRRASVVARRWLRRKVDRISSRAA
jgi:hypothetical protein